jgi:hypothetical protein
MTRTEKHILLVAVVISCGYILITDPLDLLSHLPDLLAVLRKHLQA